MGSGGEERINPRQNQQEVDKKMTVRTPKQRVQGEWATRPETTLRFFVRKYGVTTMREIAKKVLKHL